MGYWDGLTNGSFKKDKNGNTIFFLWGILGKGRVLPDEATETKARGFLRRYYQVTLPIIIGAGVIFGWAWSLLLVPIFGAWFYLGTKPLVSGCPHSDDKLTLKESYANSAASHNKFTLWFLFICLILFILASILMATTAESSSEVMVSLLCTAFFGACGTAIGYMLKVKRNA